MVYKFNGKELDSETGLYYYGARYYVPELSIWLSVDPLADKYPSMSPFMYCAGNPVMLVDPDGMRIGIFIDGEGNVVGDDGIDDKKVYVLKTTQSTFGSGNNVVQGAGLEQEQLDCTIGFIKENSGKTEAFKNDPIAYNNSIEIEGSMDARQAMVNEISKDNGMGGRSNVNNREYGGGVNNGVVIPSLPGPISDPTKDKNASIALPSLGSTFHSHQSGTRLVKGSSGYQFKGYLQTPSRHDINIAGQSTHYQFSRHISDRNVYIYNSKGVQATIPTKSFVNFNR